MKNYSYKAIDEMGNIIHLSSVSDLSYQEQVEQEYFLSDNYCIIEETYDTETEEVDSIVLMKKVNGIITVYKKRKPKAPIKLKITYTNGDVEIINRTDALKRFEGNLDIKEYEEGHHMRYEFYISKIERIDSEGNVVIVKYNKQSTQSKIAKPTETGLGSSTIDSEPLDDILTRALDILN